MTASKHSSPSALLLPSPTLASHSVYTRTRRPQASPQYWRKSGKAKNASSAVHLGRSTRLRRPTPPLSWNVSLSSGPMRSSVLTSWPCHSRCIRAIMLCNGSRRCERGPRSSTAGQPRWRSMTFQSNIDLGSHRPTSMASAGCPSTLHHQKTFSSKSAS